MSPIYSSIPLLLFGCPILFAISSAATRPAPDSTHRGFDLDKETIIDREIFARLKGAGRKEMENLRLDNFDEDRPQEQEYLENYGGTQEDPGLDYLLLKKRPASGRKYNYHRCYFNPVTCYRK
ncbi:uncharacterized protein LOC124408211 isoform X2 [Diprion similis]|uniref:uncharacterized protein LOC124408211 isoform X2 n=1 Tax=Diprion similis TaxID=362088 RepID=UPI001EF83856|nr:uncharacterized protein LOC124408211 isoform X2 [Diprion similis]